MTTTNEAINLTTSTGDVKLGLLDSGTAAVEIIATEGGILNNNGVSANVALALVNIRGGALTLNAADKIGVSTSDAIMVDIDRDSSINLTLGAKVAYINNLQNTEITNNSAGRVVDGLLFINGLVSSEQNVVLDVGGFELNEAEYASLLSDDSPISVLGADFEHLFGEGDEDEIVSTIIPSVPVLVKGTNGWEFVAPTRRESLDKIKQNQKKGVKYLDWL
jgi:hypothetical protein